MGIYGNGVLRTDDYNHPPPYNGMGIYSNPPIYKPIPTTPFPPNNTPNNAPSTETPDELKGPEWSSGICGCCCAEDSNCGTCCLAGCCSGVALAFLMERLQLFPNSICPILLFTLEEIFSARSLIQMSALSLRRSLVTKLERNETQCESCCYMCCCFPCAIAQMERDAIKHNYKFRKTKTEKKEVEHCLDTFMACFGGVSEDMQLYTEDKTHKPLAAPFTQNSMLRYYIRTQ